MTSSTESPSPRRRASTTVTTPAPARDQASTTPATGLGPRDTSAPATWTTPRSPGPSTWRATGGSSSSTSPRVTAMVTTTTPRLPVWRLASSLTAPVVCWPLATSQNAPRSLSTTGCCLWTPVIPTGDSSLTPTSCPALALAISQPKPPLTKPFHNYSSNPNQTLLKSQTIPCLPTKTM